MKKTTLLAAVLLAAGFAGCKKRPADNPPVPKAQEQAAGQLPDAATQVGVSTSGAVGTALNAPGKYMNGMAANVEKARKAAAIYTQKAAETINADPGTGK